MLEFLSLITFIISFFFVLVILSLAKKTFSVNAFLLVLSSFVLWNIANYISRVSPDFSVRLWTVRIVMFITTLLCLGIIEFINFFPSNDSYLKPKVRYPILVIYAIIAILCLSDIIIADITLDINSQTLPVFGKLVFIYFFALIASIVVFSIISFRKYKKGETKIQEQIKLIAYGILVTGTLGIFTNVFFVLLNSADFVALGPLFALILIAFVTFAIIKYQLFEIRILFGRITYFLLTGAIAYAAFYLVIFVDNTFFGGVYEPGAYIAGIFIAILFVVLFNSTNHFIRQQVSSRIINPFYDPNEVIAELNGKITTILSYEEITNQTLETISKTLRPSYQGILIVRKDQNIGAVSIKLIQTKESLTPISVDKLNLAQSIWKVVGFMPINIDKIENEYPPILKNLEKEVYSLLEELKRCNLKVLYPLHQSGELLSILILGHKEASLPYNTIEQSFIASIADLASLALARAFLYAEVEEFNRTLQKKVDDATEEIKDKNKKLQDTLNFERDMLDILGHELRTPLGTARNALLTMQKLSTDNNLDPANLNKLLGMSIDHIRREVQLLETILASTKVDNAKLDLAITKVDAKKIAQTSFEIYNTDAEKKEIKLSILLPENEIFCMADSLRLQQVIDNIVSNAVKYTFKGEIEISLEEDQNFVKFIVKDTGEGISKTDIPNLGKKFFRVNTYLKSEGKLADNRKIVRPGGTGIGLYVVFELSKAMKGRVEVKSELGKGSTFTVFVPKAE